MHEQLIFDKGLREMLKVNKFALLGTSSIVDGDDIKRAIYCFASNPTLPKMK